MASIGDRHGALIFLSDEGTHPYITRSGRPAKDNGRERMWSMRCDCGKERLFVARQVRDGNSKSCGCQIQTSNGRLPNRVIDADTLRALMIYDPLTGIFTRRENSRKSKAGAVLGTRTSNGYVQIRVRRKPYLAHRLAWLYVHGVWPKDLIDHIDCNSLNNAINNLREATQAQNMANLRISAKNKTGYKGIILTRAGKYEARCKQAGRVHVFGTFENIDSARTAYAAGVRHLHGSFARVA